VVIGKKAHTSAYRWIAKSVSHWLVFSAMTYFVSPPLCFREIPELFLMFYIMRSLAFRNLEIGKDELPGELTENLHVGSGSIWVLQSLSKLPGFLVNVENWCYYSTLILNEVIGLCRFRHGRGFVFQDQWCILRKEIRITWPSVLEYQRRHELKCSTGLQIWLYGRGFGPVTVAWNRGADCADCIIVWSVTPVSPYAHGTSKPSLNSNFSSSPVAIKKPMLPLATSLPPYKSVQ